MIQTRARNDISTREPHSFHRRMQFNFVDAEVNEIKIEKDERERATLFLLDIIAYPWLNPRVNFLRK